jgi:hypothetical protein
MQINIELAEQRQMMLTLHQSIDDVKLKLGIIMDLLQQVTNLLYRIRYLKVGFKA